MTEAPPREPDDTGDPAPEPGDPPAGGPIVYEPPWREARVRITGA